MEGTTIIREVKSNPKDRIEIEIGDSKQPDFKPQFKVSRWDNEVNFSVRAQEEAGAVVVEEDGKVKYKGKDIEVHQYDRPDASEDGGHEFEWVLKKKPKSNVLRTTIQHKGLDFFYQPALTTEEIEQGAVRDENVVGSYAVYHSTKRNNIVDGMEYKTGKAFHIYRPHAVDADGVKVWCELDITEGELTVTVPQDFLSNASYPVVVDPTFGFTSAGVTSNNIYYNPSYGDNAVPNGNDFTLTETGDVTSISVYVATLPASYTDCTMFAGIFAAGVTVPHSRQGGSASLAAITTTAAFVELTYTGPSLIAADYKIVAYMDCDGAGSYNTATTKYDTGGTNSISPLSSGVTGATAMAETLTDSSDVGSGTKAYISPTYGSRKNSIYVTYTASTANSNFFQFL